MSDCNHDEFDILTGPEGDPRLGKEICIYCGELRSNIEKWAASKEVLRVEALAEYQQHKAQKAKEADQEECPHDEHESGYCIECGKDIMDDLVGQADCLRDE